MASLREGALRDGDRAHRGEVNIETTVREAPARAPARPSGKPHDLLGLAHIEVKSVHTAHDNKGTRSITVAFLVDGQPVEVIVRRAFAKDAALPDASRAPLARAARALLALASRGVVECRAEHGD